MFMYESKDVVEFVMFGKLIAPDSAAVFVKLTLGLERSGQGA
jgi:hypothetical protein